MKKPTMVRSGRHFPNYKLEVSSGYAARAPGGQVKVGPDGKNVHGRPIGVQWQNGDLASVFPKEDARAPMMKT